MNGMKVAKPDVPTLLLWKFQFFWDMMMCCWVCSVCRSWDFERS